MPGSTASRSSSNHTNPKPGGLRATQASLIWPKSRKKSRRSRASASGGKLPTKTCTARECPRSSARPRGTAQDKHAAFAALVRACMQRCVVRLAPRGLPYLGALVRVTCTHIEPVSYPPRKGGSAAPGRLLPSAPLTHWMDPPGAPTPQDRPFPQNGPVLLTLLCWRGSFVGCLQVFLQGFHRPLSRAWRGGQ